MKTSRNAISLIELLVIMSGCSVVLSLSSVLLCRVMRIQADSRATAGIERTTLRLAEQFRHDVRRARTATINQSAANGQAFLRLALADGGQAEYSRTDPGVLRLASQEGHPAWREEFALPTACELTIAEKRDPNRVALTLVEKRGEPRTDKIATVANHSARNARVGAMPFTLHVEAIVGHELPVASERGARETSK